MDTSRIKIKIGEHEFEAEGPAELVKEQFEAFKNIISSLPNITPQKNQSDTVKGLVNHLDAAGIPMLKYDAILHVDGRIVSLTAIPPSTEDAALLIMLGHRQLRDNTSVTGQEIGDGLAQSGRPVPRVDRIMEDAIQAAFVLKTGIKRATKYRLTNQGFVKAQGLARELIASLP
jgi:hypothetical protein